MASIDTVLNFPRGIDLPIMQEIEEICSRLNRESNVSSRASFAGAEMYVCYSVDGVQLTFNRRLARMPTELAECKPNRVRIEVSATETSVPDGIYRRNGSALIIEPARYTPPPRKSITIEARTLQRANNLFQDLLNGKFPTSQQ